MLGTNDGCAGEQAGRIILHLCLTATLEAPTIERPLPASQTMRVTACVMMVLASAAMSASAQNFVNLDFDQAQLPDPAEGFFFLPWDKGAPGWGHSDGENTDHLTPDVHLGFSQTYALMPAPFGPASGLFGLGMRSGTFYEQEPRGNFVRTFLTQTGTVGAAVTSVSLLTSSYLFELSLNGNRIDMRPVGLDPESPTYAEDLTRYEGEWTGDVSAFAAQVVELRISNLEFPQDSARLIVDEIRFLPVPEMSTAALFGPGLATVLLGAAWSTRARRARPGSPRGAGLPAARQ